MIKEIKTEKFEGIAVFVHDDINSLSMKNCKLFYEGYIYRPNARWKALGFESDIPEKKCADIVDRMVFREVYYKNYACDSVYFESAKKSFKTLLYKLGCYTIDSNNKYPKGNWLIIEKL